MVGKKEGRKKQKRKNKYDNVVKQYNPCNSISEHFAYNVRTFLPFTCNQLQIYR